MTHGGPGAAPGQEAVAGAAGARGGPEPGGGSRSHGDIW
jgi:hypothetical protein